MARLDKQRGPVRWQQRRGVRYYIRGYDTTPHEPWGTQPLVEGFMAPSQQGSTAVLEVPDVNQMTVAEAKEYADAHPEHADEMLDDEVAGQNRVTLVSYLEALVGAQS